MLDFLFYDNIELPESSVREEEDGGELFYLIETPLDGRIVYIE